MDILEDLGGRLAIKLETNRVGGHDFRNSSGRVDFLNRAETFENIAFSEIGSICLVFIRRTSAY